MDPTKKRIRHVKRLAEAAVPLKHHWETPGPGRGMQHGDGRRCWGRPWGIFIRACRLLLLASMNFP